MWKTKREGLTWMWVTERNIRNNVKESIVEEQLWFFRNGKITYFKRNQDDQTWETNINPVLDIKRTYRYRNPNFATCRPFLEKLPNNAIQ